MTRQVIMDGDWGGDEMQLAAVLQASDDVNILGATAVFGNASHDYTFENGRNILHLLKAKGVKVYPGAEKSSDDDPDDLDLAHGIDGIGGAELDESSMPRETKPAVDFILETLRDNPSGTIDITASGPLTNIADAIRRDPETMKKAKNIIIMGGCTRDIPAHDIESRRGNINYETEFNFFKAAKDAKDVMESGLPITLLPMNCTHQLTLTPEREERLAKTYMTNPKVKEALLKMMKAPANLDRTKFNSAPVMHDIHCALYLLHPEEYETIKGDVTVHEKDGQDIPNSRGGRTDFVENEASNVTVAESLKDPNKLFDIFMDSIQKCIPAQRQAGIVR